MNYGEVGETHIFDAFPAAKREVDFIPDELVDSQEIRLEQPHIRLLDSEQQKRVRVLLENDSKHGDPHTGRLEDWYSQFMLQSNLKEMPFFLDYGRSAIDAIPRHDLVEVVTDIKPLHRQRGAMFSLVIDTVVQNDFDTFQRKMNLNMTKDEWIRKKWATAFHILHHHPESMPTTDEIMNRGYLIDIRKIHREAGDFGDIFEPYRTLHYLVEQCVEEDHPIFSRQEIEAIRTHTYLVAAADKMDQLTPIQLSSNRTILLNPARPLYEPHKRHTNIRKEFQERVIQGGQSECDDTLSRFLFEMCRTGAFVDAPLVVQRTYTMALRQKTHFLYNATLSYLKGDFTPFVSIYDDMELGAKDNVLLGLGYRQEDRNSILRHSNGTLRSDSTERIRQILDIYRFDPRLLDSTLESIKGEKYGVLASLQSRYDLMKSERLLQSYHTQRIEDLLAMAVDTMESNLNPEWVGDVELPYVSYYPINWERYEQKKLEM